jgi:hypothetical protein
VLFFRDYLPDIVLMISVQTGGDFIAFATGFMLDCMRMKKSVGA